MRIRTLITLSVLGALALLSPAPAEAGCGCDKPPPPLAAIRPAFAPPGGTVTLFATGLVVGQSYSVTFTNGVASATVAGVATLKRDFADGVAKPQVTVTVPPLPLGPTAVSLNAGPTSLLAIPATDFTTLPAPVALTEETGETIFYCYHAAIGADGTTYIPLDIAAIAQRMIFNGFGQGYPLSFTAADIAIYNTQGVLMQLLGPANAPIYAITDDKGTDNSFSLTYDRHEFLTYRSQHVHEGGLLLDPTDPVWHLDGTRHIDHDNLVIAIRGTIKNGSLPAPGASKSFNLDIATALDSGTGRTARNVDLCTTR